MCGKMFLHRVTQACGGLGISKTTSAKAARPFCSSEVDLVTMSYRLPNYAISQRLPAGSEEQEVPMLPLLVDANDRDIDAGAGSKTNKAPNAAEKCSPSPTVRRIIKSNAKRQKINGRTAPEHDVAEFGLSSNSAPLKLLLQIDHLVYSHVLNYLIKAEGNADEAIKSVENYSTGFPAFRSVNRNNDLWERLCRSRWKTFWGYDIRLKAALGEKLQDGSPDYWYRKYHITEADATRSYITANEITTLTFSCRQWFHPLGCARPPGFRVRPGIVPSGIRYSESDSIWFNVGSAKFSCGTVIGSGRITGHPSGEIDWYLQDEGRVVNIVTPRNYTSKYSSFQVRRLPDWGWELTTDCKVMRALDRPASPQTIKELWKEYTQSIVLQPIPQELQRQAGGSYPFQYREIPNIDRLKSSLSMIRNNPALYE